MTIYDLPAVNASLNGLSAIFLTSGFIFIKRGNKIAHRNCMISAFATSIIFLGCYLTYHGYLAYELHRGPTRFLNPEWFRPIYLTILLTHTILAIVIVPMILITLAFRSEKFINIQKKLFLSITLLAIAMFVVGLVIGFAFGAPRSFPPHFNKLDEIAVACVAFSICLGFVSLLLFVFDSHKAIARWTWPLWMYVSVTGVIVYLLLYQIFPQK